MGYSITLVNRMKTEREITDAEMKKLVKLKYVAPEHFRCRFIELFGKNVSKDDVRIFVRAVYLMERMDELLSMSN